MKYPPRSAALHLMPAKITQYKERFKERDRGTEGERKRGAICEKNEERKSYSVFHAV